MGKGKPNKNLLIISCSQRKNKVQGKVKAWDLYDGVFFRMLKKIEREKGLPANLEVLILSARYGFVAPSELIEYYNCRLRPTDIEERRVDFLQSLNSKTKNKKYTTIVVCLGKDYLRGIRGFESGFCNRTNLIIVDGGIGLKLSKTKKSIFALMPDK